MKLTWADVTEELGHYNLELEHSGLGVRGLHDRFYWAIPDQWFLEKFLPWWHRYIRQYNLQPTPDDEEGFDCDDIADIFVAELRKSVKHGLGKAGVIASRASVYNLIPWGGIDQRGGHMLNIVRTDVTWRAVEPQTSFTAPLAVYPNLQNMENRSLDF